MEPELVAPHLWPTRTFDAACATVVAYLARSVPMGMWAATRIVDAPT